MDKIQKNQHQDGAAIQADVVIVGYGPVGAALAVYLGKLGVSTVVVEKNSDILPMPRAIALDNEALRVLQNIGLSDDSFEKITINHVRMYCPFLGKFGELNTSGKIDELPKLVTFYQPDLEKALRNKASSSSDVHVLLNTEFISFDEQPDAIHVAIRNPAGVNQTIHAQYLVGADGASSKIRSSIGFDFRGASYCEDWLIVDAKNRQGKSIDHVEFICDPKRPTPHMPAPGGRERWEFMLHANETREEMENPEKIQALLQPWMSGQDIEIERQAVYRFHARCCERFQKGRVFLVGDAAHITPPFVGQGLVAGLRDIANLGWKLKFALKAENAKEILDSYDAERRPHAAKMIQLAKGMGLMVMPKNKIKAIAVHGLIKSLSKFPLTKHYLTELKVKPQIRYKNGFFQPKKGYWNSTKTNFEVGKQADQILLKNSKNQIFKSDDCWGDSFILLGIDVDPATLLNEGLQHQWKVLGGKILTVSTRLNHQNLNGFMDIEQKWAAKKNSPYLVILRPDGIAYNIFEISEMTRSLALCINQLA
ncbi:bifunctional 3-(3-hydroxy-phenyl)propionate/3-hydroxycinnamic acid hydroxylase [Acinetobacter pragensis]|uniref:FAD-binding domain-containing protein n=1 Tax=Acinetobacter pragensis TaxID=1806892 RepID=A0A151Y424_9GAMM|nr:bifunctional 3-(3-hydroxy-phenyl)propionate/3-hydroxycinnamic acid hydroxylase [Acinetobacter pragensis]KYQ72768.1 hypothetical protein AZH43_07890 [Acinetobacter pragensis]